MSDRTNLKIFTMLTFITLIVSFVFLLSKARGEEGWIHSVVRVDSKGSNRLHETENEFVFASYYADHMVLQRAPARAYIWGYAPLSDVGQNVKVITVANTNNSNLSTYQAKVTKGPFPDQAIWKVQLLPTTSSESFTITASLSGHSPIKITDVLFGDVWVCSGQSNMVFTVNEMFNATHEYNIAANFPHVRLMKVRDVASNTTFYDIKQYDQMWALPSKDTLAGFSAVCWLYGRRVNTALNVPMGLIVSAWGGTPVEAWSSPESLRQCGLQYQENHYGECIPFFDGMPCSTKPAPPQQHHVLYNSMIHPLLNMTIYGVLWYQGEQNAHVNTNIYNCTFPAMISDWRQKWNQATQGQTASDFPFGFVQLGPNRADGQQYIVGFPDIRWHQTADIGYVPNGRLHNVFMACAMDLADPMSPHYPVHYRDKGTVGERISLAGLSVAYRQPHLVYQGPWPSTALIDPSKMILRLIYNGGFLPKTSITVRNKQGFEVCCRSNKTECTMQGDDWTAVNISQSDSISVTLTLEACAHQYVLGIRYIWRETPCPYKQCPVYSVQNELPAPPLIHMGFMADMRDTKEQTYVFRKQ